MNSGKKSLEALPKKKIFGQYTPQHQTRMKRQLKEECHATLSFLGLYDYVATKIEVYNEATGKLETFRLLEEDELPLTGNEEKDMSEETH